MHRKGFLFGCLLAAMAFTGSRAVAQTRFRVHVLIANKADFGPDILDPNLVNAWGLAIRPAGFGGHFWFANYGNGTSDEYVGDVAGTPLFQDFAAGPDEVDGLFGYVETVAPSAASLRR